MSKRSDFSVPTYIILNSFPPMTRRAAAKVTSYAESSSDEDWLRPKGKPEPAQQRRGGRRPKPAPRDKPLDVEAAADTEKDVAALVMDSPCNTTYIFNKHVNKNEV